ncbi:MAG: chromosomal replication initiator protein DnaA [Acidobacteriota bacterium]|jgi:chromosomal replication initiator protein
MAQLWDRVLQNLEGRLNRQTFETWLKPTHQLSQQGDQLDVWVPSSRFADWIDTNFRAQIQDALREIGREAQVRYVPGEDAPDPAPPRRAAVDEAWPASPGLNARYTFDSFVVSSCNQFAHAASKAVAELPSKSYNPLYIYGGVGLGKTHLMHAIGNAAQSSSGRPLRMAYVSTERFMNELINAIRFEKTLEFKDRYRNVDLLLVDDIQFLAGKERTQEEFFHTFNALHDSQAQIVLTSDCPPRDIPTLEERLRSRFEWGLIADIQPPDLETKIAILRKKAEAEGIDLPQDVALFIASKIRSNIRELEGSLIRIQAFSSISGRQIDLELASETLKDILQDEDNTPTMEAIQRHIANHYRLKPAVLKERNNSASVAFPRQVAMYLCKRMTSHSLPEIGRHFGGKHHSTVIHSIRKIEEKRKSEADFDKLVHSFEEAFRTS